MRLDVEPPREEASGVCVDFDGLRGGQGPDPDQGFLHVAVDKPHVWPLPCQSEHYKKIKKKSLFLRKLKRHRAIDGTG